MSDTPKFGLWVVLLLAAVGSLALVFFNFPPLKPEHRDRFKLPKSIADVRELGEIMSNYKEDYYFTVLTGYSLVYIFLQTFSIPGSIFLSFLGGTLFGMWVGLPLVCALSATGASGAYLMSYLIGRWILNKYAPEKLELFARKVAEQRHNLWFYFLFLRVTPLLPNWFVNLASPVANIPLRIFWVGTFFGVMPQSILAVKAGLTLHEVQSVSDVLDFRYFLSLVVLAFVALIPTLKPVQDRLDRIFNKSAQNKQE